MNQPLNKVAVVTGAGSGIGRAVALTLARHGVAVALVGRGGENLNETIALAGSCAGSLVAFPCDISNRAALAAMAQAVLTRFGGVDILVNAAGTNTPRRALGELSVDDYERIMGANLSGAFHAVQLFLPTMRQRGGGTIVCINSEAGLRASPKSGAAYVMSKFGLTGLTQTINAEERANGIRACGIFPGDVDTPLLRHRPVVPGAEARARMLQPEDVAECVWLAVNLPPRAIIEELIIRPSCTP